MRFLRNVISWQNQRGWDVWNMKYEMGKWVMHINSKLENHNEKRVLKRCRQRNRIKYYKWLWAEFKAYFSTTHIYSSIHVLGFVMLFYFTFIKNWFFKYTHVCFFYFPGRKVGKVCAWRKRVQRWEQNTSDLICTNVCTCIYEYNIT